MHIIYIYIPCGLNLLWHGNNRNSGDEKMAKKEIIH